MGIEGFSELNEHDTCAEDFDLFSIGIVQSLYNCLSSYDVVALTYAVGPSVDRFWSSNKPKAAKDCFCFKWQMYQQEVV
jgi:hypothetical protein